MEQTLTGSVGLAVATPAMIGSKDDGSHGESYSGRPPRGEGGFRGKL